MWLEEYLSNWDKILFFVCHSQDFMNQVCTHIVRLDMTYKKLRYFSGNYDMYVQTRRDQDMVQMRQYEAEQRDVAEIKDFIARFGHGTVKMVRQAQAREKLLQKKLEAGLTPLPEQDPDWGKYSLKVERTCFTKFASFLVLILFILSFLSYRLVVP